MSENRLAGSPPAISLPQPWDDLSIGFRVRVDHSLFRSRLSFLETYAGWGSRSDWTERRQWILRDGCCYSAFASEGSPQLEFAAVRRRTHLTAPVLIRRREGVTIAGEVECSTKQRVPDLPTVVRPSAVERWRHEQTRTFRTTRWSFRFSRVWESASGYSRLLRDRMRGTPPTYEIAVVANANSDIFAQGPEYVRQSLQLKIEDLFFDEGVSLYWPGAGGGVAARAAHTGSETN